MSGFVTEEIAIAISGTEGTCTIPRGCRLVGLFLPSLDSTQVTPQLSFDGTTYKAVYDGAGTQILIGGSANTGDRWVTAPDALQLIVGGAQKLKLVVASQTTAARTIRAVFAQGAR